METVSFFDAIEQTGAHRDGEKYRFYLSQIADGVDFRGKRVLDVGGGVGLLTFFALSQGAELAVCLEPEAAGSSRGMRDIFRATADVLDTGERAILEPTRLQDFSWDREPFDVVLLHNSINHIDEAATISLGYDESARECYREIFRKIGSLCAPDARMLVADCDRYNFWRLIPYVKAPAAPSINWSKHQPPERWASLAEAGGFRRERVVWTSFNRLGRPGRILFGNRVAAYMIKSHFAMWLRKHPGVTGRAAARRSA